MGWVQALTCVEASSAKGCVLDSARCQMRGGDVGSVTTLKMVSRIDVGFLATSQNMIEGAYMGACSVNLTSVA